MSGYISEFFGYRAEDKSVNAMKAANEKICPFFRKSMYQDLIS